MAALFEFRGVSVERDGRRVPARFSAAIADRGITVVTGPSGSGKSTLLRLCNRLLVPAEGTVLFGGTDVATLDPLALRRRVGMVFQQPTPFPGTVLDNLRTAAELDRDEAAGLLASVDLDPAMLDRDARDLSGGEQQRVCLARTLATHPEVLLVDEGTSALDEAATAILEELVRGIADGGRPVVWVTHDLAQADRLADHRLAMDAGPERSDDDG